MLLAVLKCKHTSPTVMRYCGLYVYERSREFYTRTNFERVLRQCAEILRLDPMTYRLCTLRSAAELVTVVCRPYIGEADMLTEELRAELVLALKIAVEKVMVNFEMHKSLASLVNLVQLFERSQQESSRHRPKTLATSGITQVGEEGRLDLYEKFVYSTREEVERDFHRFFLIKRLLEDIGLKPPGQYDFQPASEKDLVHAAKFLGKEVDVTNEQNIHCLYRLDEQHKPEKRYLVA